MKRPLYRKDTEMPKKPHEKMLKLVREIKPFLPSNQEFLHTVFFNKTFPMGEKKSHTDIPLHTYYGMYNFKRQMIISVG